MTVVKLVTKNSLQIILFFVYILESFALHFKDNWEKLWKNKILDKLIFGPGNQSSPANSVKLIGIANIDQSYPGRFPFVAIRGYSGQRPFNLLDPENGSIRAN